MPSILYVWKSPYPWDVRVDKICTSLAESGFDVTILARWTFGQKKEEKHKNFRIVRAGFEMPWEYSTPVSFNPVWKNAIKATAVTYKVDLIIVREIMLATASAKVAKELGIPVIMDMAEHYPSAMKLWNKYKKGFLKKAFVHWLDIPERVEQFSVPKMNGIITVCREQNQRLHEKYRVPFEKIRVVHNTPLISQFINVRLGSARPPIVFGHHGYMTSEKNLDNLVKGFLIAADEFSEIELFLAGSGDCLEGLKDIVNNSKHGKRVSFSGNFNYSEMPAILSKIDVGVIPYEINDFNEFTIHNKIFDFMACGKPVIVNTSKPYQRIIEETGCGLSVDCSNPENIAEAIRVIREMDVINFTIKGLKASYLKYNWYYDELNLIKFIHGLLAK